MFAGWGTLRLRFGDVAYIVSFVYILTVGHVFFSVIFTIACYHYRIDFLINILTL